MIREAKGEDIRQHYSPEEWTDEDVARLTELILEHQNLIEEIRRMAERGGPAHLLDFSKGSRMEMPKGATREFP